MCTAIYDNLGGAFLGRTLDVERDYGQSAVSVPKGTELDTKYEGKLKYGFSVIGTAFMAGGVPLFFDGLNSEGLAACALNFGSSCGYHSARPRMLNLASFEVIPYVLSQFCTVCEVEKAFLRLNVTVDSFGELEPTPLHWIFADKKEAITVESVKGGTKIYKNEVGVLTNAPGFDYQLYRASEIMNLSNEGPRDNLTDGSLFRYSRGMGAIGLPGDSSSVSRFMRALFNKRFAERGGNGVTRMMHLFDSVDITRGTVICEDGTPSFTAYTSVMDLDKKVYYFTTYGNRQIRALSIENGQKCKQVCAYTMKSEQKIKFIDADV